MDINNNLLQNKKEDLILFLEIVALLHDIGKLSTAFIQSKAIDNSKEDIHALLPLTDNLPEIFQKSITIHSNNSKQKPFELNPFTIICSHHGCERCQKECPFKNNNPIVNLLRLADQKTAEEEKGFLLDTYRQPQDDTYFSTPLGKESKVFAIIDDYRNLLWKVINKALEKENMQEIRDEIFKAVKIAYTSFPSETRRPGNDLSLWEHSFIAATYFKIALYEMLINGKNVLSTQKIPIIFLKINSKQDGLKDYLESIYCAGNLVLSFGGYRIYALGESFLKNHPLLPGEVSESFFSLIPDLEGEMENINRKDAKSVFIPDYRNIFQLNPESSFTHPLTRSLVADSQAILNKVMIQNYLREQKEIEERIKSINRHIKNLEKGIMKDDKKKEHLEKLEEIARLNASLDKLSTIGGAFNINDDPFLLPNIPPYEISILNLYQNWLIAGSDITFKEFALYSLFQRKPSVSSCLSLLREVEKLLIVVKDLLLEKGCHCWIDEGILYIKDPLTDDLLLECKKIIDQYSDKSIGLIPIYSFRVGKKPISYKKKKKIFYKVKNCKYGFSSENNFLFLQFENKKPVNITLTRNDGKDDEHRLYRKYSNGRYVHLSEVNAGDSILWFFPLEKYQ